jgi:hypothetical protein
VASALGLQWRLQQDMPERDPSEECLCYHLLEAAKFGWEDFEREAYKNPKTKCKKVVQFSSFGRFRADMDIIREFYIHNHMKGLDFTDQGSEEVQRCQDMVRAICIVRAKHVTLMSARDGVHKSNIEGSTLILGL